MDMQFTYVETDPEGIVVDVSGIYKHSGVDKMDITMTTPLIPLFGDFITLKSNGIVIGGTIQDVQAHPNRNEVKITIHRINVYTGGY